MRLPPRLDPLIPARLSGLPPRPKGLGLRRPMTSSWSRCLPISPGRSGCPCHPFSPRWARYSRAPMLKRSTWTTFARACCWTEIIPPERPLA